MKQCRRFISTIIQEVHHRTSQHFVAWAAQQLEKRQEAPEVQKLVQEFKKWNDTKSRYMEAIDELDEQLRKEKIF